MQFIIYRVVCASWHGGVLLISREHRDPSVQITRPDELDGHLGPRPASTSQVFILGDAAGGRAEHDGAA